MRGRLTIGNARPFLSCVVAVSLWLAAPTPAHPTDEVHDEIQVYNAAIAEVGQWTIEQHLNYAWVGQTQPEFPGGITCPFRKSYPDELVMQPRQDRNGDNGA